MFMNNNNSHLCYVTHICLKSMNIITVFHRPYNLELPTWIDKNFKFIQISTKKD